MNQFFIRERSACVAIQIFEPEAGAVYHLDAAARLAGVSRRMLLRYHQLGLIHPRLGPPLDPFHFDDAAIQTVRQMEGLRRRYGLNLAGIKMLFELMEELEQLRSGRR